MRLEASATYLPLLEVQLLSSLSNCLEWGASISGLFRSAVNRPRSKPPEVLTAVVIAVVTARIHYYDGVALAGSTQSDAILQGPVAASSVWAYSHCESWLSR